MAKRMGLLAGSVDFSNAAADEFHDWLDTEHIPERTRLPGVIGAVRWLGIANPCASLVLYDLESLDVLRTPEYLAVSFKHFSPWSVRLLNTGKTKRITRFACEQIWPGDARAPLDAKGLAVYAMNVEPGAEEDFNRWYDTEHVPALVNVPGVRCLRRYMSRMDSGEKFVTHKYVTLIHLDSPDTCDSPAWKHAMGNADAVKMYGHTTQMLHMLMRPYQRRPDTA